VVLEEMVEEQIYHRQANLVVKQMERQEQLQVLILLTEVLMQQVVEQDSEAVVPLEVLRLEVLLQQVAMAAAEVKAEVEVVAQ
jgi:hypothetical protein